MREKKWGREIADPTGGGKLEKKGLLTVGRSNLPRIARISAATRTVATLFSYAVDLAFFRPAGPRAPCQTRRRRNAPAVRHARASRSSVASARARLPSVALGPTSRAARLPPPRSRAVAGGGFFRSRTTRKMASTTFAALGLPRAAVAPSRVSRALRAGSRARPTRRALFTNAAGTGSASPSGARSAISRSTPARKKSRGAAPIS